MTTPPRPLIPEDVNRLRCVSDVQLSPDARHVAFVVRTVDRKRDTFRSAIFVVGAEGGEPYQITIGEREDVAPRWCPDGRSIAFLSDRGPGPDGKKRAPRNVFVHDPTRTERQLTDFDSDVTDLVWSPNGARICVVAKQNWQAGGEPTIPVYDELPYKIDGEGLLDGRRRHLWLVDLPSSRPLQLTEGNFDDLQPSWSADGDRIAFISNRTGNRDLQTIHDVWTISVRGREPARRITNSDGPQKRPSFAPNGKSIAYYGHRDPRAGNAKNIHLFVHLEDGAEPRDLLSAWDRTVGSPAVGDTRSLFASGLGTNLPAPVWSEDGTCLYFLGNDRGTTNLYEACLDGDMPRPVTSGEHQVLTVSFDTARRRFGALIESPTEPGDVFVGQVGTGELSRLTAVNAMILRGVHLTHPEPIAFAGADGWKIEGWLLKPPQFDSARRYPLVLHIHGGPHLPYGHAFYQQFQVLAGAGYLVLYTNPRGSHSYGERFAHAVVGDHGGKDYVDLMAAVDFVIARGFVDDTRLGVAGHSYGGFMTNWIIGHTARFAAAASSSSISNLESSFGTRDIGRDHYLYEQGANPYDDPERYRRRSPITYVDDIRTPLLILHPEHDHTCPIEQAEQFFTALRYLGKPARFIRYPNGSHDLPTSGTPSHRVHHIRSVVEWFNRYLASPSPDNNARGASLLEMTSGQGIDRKRVDADSIKQNLAAGHRA